jgi:hypothetical protein
MPSSVTPEVEIEFDESEDFDNNDFAFVIDQDGNLKTFMMPEHMMTDPPEEVSAILEMFGIDDIHTLTQRLLH